ncbi:MAG: M50 family metallopeptidase, partial [Actinomycetota bacterium]
MPGTATGAPLAGEALRRMTAGPQYLFRRITGGPQYLAAGHGSLAHRVSGLWHHAFAAQPLPPLWLVLGSGLLALAVVGSRLWPVARIVVTIVHEGGHALVALAAGRRLAGVRLYRDTAGVTVSAGKPDGPGIVFTTAAGYPAPSLLGLGAAALLTAGHLTAMLLLSLVLLAGLAIAIRNAYGMLAVLVTAAAVAVVCLYASAEIQAGFGYAMAWFLLLGGVRPVIELQRDRRRGGAGGSDAEQLARLTSVPGGAWVVLFGLF